MLKIIGMDDTPVKE